MWLTLHCHSSHVDVTDGLALEERDLIAAVAFAVEPNQAETASDITVLPFATVKQIRFAMPGTLPSANRQFKVQPNE